MKYDRQSVRSSGVIEGVLNGRIVWILGIGDCRVLNSQDILGATLASAECNLAGQETAEVRKYARQLS